MNSFGYENCVDIFWVITKLDFIERSFPEVKVQNGGYFWGW